MTERLGTRHEPMYGPGEEKGRRCNWCGEDFELQHLATRFDGSKICGPCLEYLGRTCEECGEQIGPIGAPPLEVSWGRALCGKCTEEERQYQKSKRVSNL